MTEQGLTNSPIPVHRQSWAAATSPDTLTQTTLWDFSGVNNQGCDTTKFSSYVKFKQMLIQLVIINLQLDKRKTQQEKICKNFPSRTYHRHWGILQDLGLDKRVLVLVAAQDIAGVARRTGGHCDDTGGRKKKNHHCNKDLGNL